MDFSYNDNINFELLNFDSSVLNGNYDHFCILKNNKMNNIYYQIMKTF